MKKLVQIIIIIIINVVQTIYFYMNRPTIYIYIYINIYNVDKYGRNDTNIYKLIYLFILTFLLDLALYI